MKRIREGTNSSKEYVEKELEELEHPEKQTIAKPMNKNQDQAGELVQPQVQKKKFSSEFCLMSLWCGLIGLILPPFSTLAIIEGLAGFLQVRREHLSGKWMAVTGIILGVIGILIFMLAALVVWSVLQGYIDQLSQLQPYLSAGTPTK